MTTREDLLKIAEEWKRHNPDSKKPIYIIYTLEYPYSKATYYVPWLGQTVTFPSPGVIEDASIFCLHRDLDQAIKYLNENSNAVQDGSFEGAFILLKIPGIAPFNTPETRMFFRWNEKRRGFFQEKEPDHFNDFPIIPGDYSA